MTPETREANWKMIRAGLAKCEDNEVMHKRIGPILESWEASLAERVEKGEENTQQFKADHKKFLRQILDFEKAYTDNTKLYHEWILMEAWQLGEDFADGVQ